MNLNNALITGGSGMIGSNIHFGFKPSSSQMDVTNLKSIESYVGSLKNISCIIHLASINLRESEANCSNAIEVNISGTTNMLRIAMKLNIPFVLLSTGASFSSSNPDIVFDEFFNTCPNCVYGHTKSASERVSLLYDKTIIIRTGWLFGGNQKMHYKFVEHTINNLITNNEIKASNDFNGSPTYVLDLIMKMCELVTNLTYGIHHIVNSGRASGYDIAIEIANKLDKPKSLIVSTNSHHIPNSGPQRSRTEVLESLHPFNRMRSWKESLSEYIEKYMNVKNIEIKAPNEVSIKKWEKRKVCRLCDSYNLFPFFNLEPTPPANHFVSEPVFQEVIPLDICVCYDCKHIQLLEIVDPGYQYSDYFYVSSTSSTMTNHLKHNVIEFAKMLDIAKTDHILEIGANDGVCVKELLDNGFLNIVGIDPASNINKRHNLPIICDFFGSKIIDKLSNNYKLIYAFHCCAHIENIQDVFQTIVQILDDDGCFIMEVGYFYEVFKNKLFDVIYHEHLDYHTVTAMQRFASRFNLTLYKVHENSIQGGSIQFLFCKTSSKKAIVDTSVFLAIEKENRIQLFNKDKLDQWQNIIIQNGRDIRSILNSFVANGKKIVGYGASAKSTTFLYQYKLSCKTIDYIIDDSIFKQNHLTPGLHIPIKSSEMLKIDKIDYIIILSWNFIDEILLKLDKYRANGLRIIIPFPEIRIF